MLEMDFYELSRAVQDRFTVSIRGEAQPRPLLAGRAGRPREVLIWSGVGIGGLVLLVSLFELGFGDLESGFAVQGVLLIGAYALLAGVVAASTLQVVSRIKERWELPYRAGVYLFPAGVVDATSHRLRMFPLSRLATPIIQTPQLILPFPQEETVSFPPPVAAPAPPCQ